MGLVHRPTGEAENMEDRRNKVWELRKAGASSRKIAAQVGVSHTTVLEDIAAVQAELHRATLQTADEFRTLELERLDSLQVPMWQLAMGRAEVPAVGNRPKQEAVPPNIEAARAVLRISDQRSKLLGIYKTSGRIDIIFIREIIKMIEQRGGDPMALFRALAETLSDTPILIDAEHYE
jgi:DNA-binding transcriptional MocR family regulator